MTDLDVAACHSEERSDDGSFRARAGRIANQSADWLARTMAANFCVGNGR